MPVDTRILNPLDTPAQRRAFDRFLPLYLDAFPVRDEREEPGAWRARIEAGPAAPTRTTVIVAGHDLYDKDALVVSGGIVTEVFPGSRTGLVSYVAVAPEAQGEGVARALVDAARQAFERTAAEETARTGAPFTLRGVFAEAEDPRRYADPAEAAAVLRRLEVLAHLGARWVDVPYLQPALDPTRSPVELLLLAVPLAGHSPYLIRTEVIWDFLAEHYGVGAPGGPLPHALAERWPRITRRLAELARETEAGPSGRSTPNGPEAAAPRPTGYAVLRLPPAREQQVLSLERVAIALHAVTVEVDAAAPSAPGASVRSRHAAAAEVARRALASSELWAPLSPDTSATLLDGAAPSFCPIFGSYEVDILNYGAIRDRPVTSVCETECPIDVEVHVPPRTDYTAEGRGVTWYGGRTRIPARLALSYSRFPDSGVRVWNVALRPRATGPDGAPADGAFTELDLIKLITLYDNEQEGSNVPAGLRLSRAGHEPLAVGDFLFELTGGALVGAAFSGGTVEIELTDSDGVVDWAALFEASARSDPGGPTLHDELMRYAEPGDGRDRLLAASGVVQGIFDYGRLSVSELGAVFRPVVRASRAQWLSINCATLLSVSTQADFLDVTADSIGISPYRVVPYAVALHNEFVARAAEAHTDRAAAETAVGALAGAADATERLLRRLDVPDPFLYSSEQTLLEGIVRHRGGLTQRATARSKGAELEARLGREKGLLADRRAHWLSAFLGFLSLVALLDVFRFVDVYREGAPLSPSVVAMGMAGAMAVLAGLYVLSRPRR